MRWLVLVSFFVCFSVFALTPPVFSDVSQSSGAGAVLSKSGIGTVRHHSDETLTFSWTANQRGDGTHYNLYMDSKDNLVAVISPITSSRVTIQKPTDGLGHDYFLTAADSTDESEISAIARYDP